MSRRNQKRRSGFTLIELLVVIVIIGILAAIALPNYIKVKEKAKEAEIKANLHNVQLSIERFAVDTEGAYPNYLIGGEPKYAANVSQGGSANAFTNITECSPIEGVSDPLLRKGYIDSYPRNPFVRSGIAIHQVQENLPSAELDGADPLRNGTPEGAQYGTRFGAHCDLMGSVLADPRYRRRDYLGPPPAGASIARTYADIEYEFWDMWIGDKPLPYLPGQFFYKGMGPMIESNPKPGQLIIPGEIDQYMLGAYGGMKTKGKDVLGEEPPGPSGSQSTAPGSAPAAEPVDIWRMTRSEVSNDLTRRQGSPYGVDPNRPGPPQLCYGNPNGYRDAIILVLTAGEDYLGNP